MCNIIDFIYFYKKSSLYKDFLCSIVYILHFITQASLENNRNKLFVISFFYESSFKIFYFGFFYCN
jgi:hypothetical protein